VERDHLLGTGRLAKPALHAGILGEAQASASRDRRRAHWSEQGGHAGEAERAARPCRARRCRRARPPAARSRRLAPAPRHATRAAQAAAPRACCRSLRSSPGAGVASAGRDGAQLVSPSASGSSVSMVATRPVPKPRPARIGSANASVLPSPVRVVARPWRARGGACPMPHRRRPQLSASRPELRHFIDGERQHVGRQAFAETRQARRSAACRALRRAPAQSHWCRRLPE